MASKQQKQVAKAVIEQMAYNQAKSYVQDIISTCNKQGLSVQETGLIVKAAKQGLDEAVNDKLKRLEEDK